MPSRERDSVTRVTVFLAVIVTIIFSWFTQATETARNDAHISAKGPPLARSLVATGLSEPSELLQFTSAGHVLGFGAGGMVVATASHALRVAFMEANPVTPQRAASALHGSQNSKDPARRALPLTSVTYPNLWEGVTLTYDARGIVRSSYHLEPYADVRAIRLRYNRPAQVQPDGSLRLAFETGALSESAPLAWQELGGRRVPVAVAFTALSETDIGFAPGVYNPAQPLFIDPTLSWSTFLGGSDSDDGSAIAMDASGNVYVAGRSFATWGAPVTAHAGNHDAFVAKLDSSGVRQWHTFLGGSGDDRGQAIAVDASGNVYVAGRSLVTWGAPVTSHAGAADAFAAQLDSSGVRQWHTFLGGSVADNALAIAVDASGNISVAGMSSTTWGAPVAPYAGGQDAFAAQLSGSGGLVWNTFLGGSGNDSSSAVAVDASGNLYLTGQSATTWGAPVTPHAGGTNDAFAAKLTSSGVRQWHTFLGGSALDSGSGIAVDASGNVYVAGTSLATWGSPLTAHAGGDDAFAAQLTSSGGLVWNTFLGGNSFDIGNAIAVDASGNLYLVGYSFTSWGAPVTPYVGSRDAFAAKLDGSGVRQWHTFLGGSADDFGLAVAVDASGHVYVAGTSLAAWGTPVNPQLGGQDAFAAKLSDAPPDSDPPETMIDSSPPNPSNSSSATFTITSDEAGSTFACQLDGGGFSACSTPQSYSSLADGSHTFEVRATDLANNTDPTQASFTWVIDTISPGTTIDSSPANLSSSSSASFGFSGTDGGTGVASFECQLDGDSFASCTSPQSYGGLSDGSHTFQVRAIDGVGNVGSSPASFSWTIDTVVPTVAISSAAPDPTNSVLIPVTAQYSENMIGFDVGDIAAGNATIGNFVAIDGDTYSFDLIPIGQGLVTVDIAAGVAQDSSGNGNGAAAQLSRAFDSIAPGVTIDQATGQADPTSNSPINFTAVFDEPVIGFATGDVTLSGTAGATTAVVTEIAPNDGTSYTVAVGGMGSDGSVTVTILSGVASDAAGNGNGVSTSTDNTVAFTATPAGPGCDGQAATIYVNAQGLVVGGPNSGTIYTGKLKGTGGNDVIVGTSGTDTIDGKGGNDRICGREGNDILLGAAGLDGLFGEGGNDTLEGGNDNDLLDGGAGNDRLKGEAGNDMLTGGSGADIFDGGSGTDSTTDFDPGQGDTKKNIP